MNAHRHRVKRRIRAAAFQLVETLEFRAYLSGIGGVVLGTPVNTLAAANNLSPVMVNSADFTGNGKDDVYVANQNDTISVLLSKGDGAFQTPVNSYAVAGAPLPLATGQFTSSGHLDIVTGTTGAGSAAGDVSILLGNGDGTFQPSINIPALHSNHALAVGHFVTGGPLDIISVSDSASHVNNVCLTITDGTGHLASQTFFSTPFGSVSAIAVGDFGNGHEDFAVSDQSIGSVSVYLGNGNGTFQTPVTYSTGAGTMPTSIVAGKFDASGNIDLVTADSTSGEVSFLANQGDGIFGTAVISPVAGSANGGGPLSVCLGQFVSGSEQDIVCLLSPGSSDDATILLGNGNGTFRTGTTITTGDGNGVAVGDLNGDGLTDVVVTSSSQITSLLNQDTTVPTAIVDASQANGSTLQDTYDFTVTYRDAQQMDAATLGNGNLTVTFPGGVQQAASLVSINLGNSASIDATYQISFPADLTSADEGTYTVAINANSVKNAGGVPVAAGVIGSFKLVVTVTVPAPASLVFTTPPANNTKGAAITPAVEILDQGGHLFTTGHPVVTLSLVNPAAGSRLVGTVSAAATNGVATFNNLSLNKAGAYTLKAAVGKVNVNSNSFSVTAPVAATALAFATEPANNAAGATIAPLVDILDQYGNVFTAGHPTVTLKLVSPPVGAHLVGKASVTAINGVAAFSSLALNEAGTFTLAAVDGSLNGTSNSFNVTVPSVATSLSYVQEPTNTPAGSKMLPAVTVEVLDQYGHFLPSDSSTVKLFVVNASTQHVATYTASAKHGVASFTGIDLTKSGTYTLAATDSKLQGNATTSYDSGSFVVSALAGVSLRLGQVPTSGQAPAGPFTITVDVLDKYGNVATGDASTVTLAITQLKPSVAAPVNATASALAGVATFSGVMFNNVGTFRLGATDGAMKPAPASSPIVITAVPNVDLTGSITSIPTSVALGHTFNVTMTLTNDGLTSAAGVLDILFELSSSSNGSNPFQVANVTTRISLAPGGSKSVTLSVPVALGSLTGDMYLMAVIDPMDAFHDVNMSNNITISTTRISFH